MLRAIVNYTIVLVIKYPDDTRAAQTTMAYFVKSIDTFEQTISNTLIATISTHVVLLFIAVLMLGATYR